MSATHAGSIAINTKRGIKRACGSDECGKRFYDLNKTPAVCPYCNTIYVAPLVKEVPLMRSKQKVYAIKQVTEETEEERPASLLDADATQDGDSDVPLSEAEDIPEIEDEDLDEGIAIAPEPDQS